MHPTWIIYLSLCTSFFFWKYKIWNDQISVLNVKYKANIFIRYTYIRTSFAPAGTVQFALSSILLPTGKIKYKFIIITELSNSKMEIFIYQLCIGGQHCTLPHPPKLFSNLTIFSSNTEFGGDVEKMCNIRKLKL